MNTVILLICKWLDVVLNWFIVMLFVYEIYLGIKTWINLSSFKKRIIRLSEPRIKKGESFWNHKNEIDTQYEGFFVNNWEEYDTFLKEYQDKGKNYAAFSLIIQLFTLLGILGTVAGLFVALQDMENASNLLDGVGFALSSTVLGIICAVLSKVFEIFLVSNYITYIEDGIERYEKDYESNRENADYNLEKARNTNQKLVNDKE